jgi:heme exporter protein A
VTGGFAPIDEFARLSTDFASSFAVSGLLSLVDVSCRRGRSLLFAGVSASLQEGQLLRVEGDNGSGKTSLLRIICGLLAPASGEVRWRDHAVARLHDSFSAELVYLGHAAALKDDLSAFENLELATRLAGDAPGRAELEAALAEAGLSTKLGAMARALSQGQRKRAALARLALSENKPLWVLDEPFTALDRQAIDWLLSLIEAHLLRGGLVVLTSHQGVPLNAGLSSVSILL